MSLRIGMLAPITHAYPPSGYGPWERVTHDLTEALAEKGHDVTLFAAEGSKTRARFYPTTRKPLSARPEADWRLVEDAHIAMALHACAELRIEVLHSHLHVHALDQADLWGGPILTTLHGVAWDRDVRRRLDGFADRPFVTLSDSERMFHPGLRYEATIPNGIDTAQFPAGGGTGQYLAFVGRIAPEKAPHLAVETARRTGLPLLLAGVIEEKHRDYADQILAATKAAGVDYLGPLDRPELVMLLQDAAATLMPLQWDEPFGLVVVESLSCGTPVIAWRRGAMPEIIDDGRTGFLVEGVDGALRAVERLGEISREACAADARLRFDRSVMADAYWDLYERLNSSGRARRATA